MIIVIVNSAGQFFCGDWANIRWCDEYPDAREYRAPSLAKKEARKLRVECPDPGIKVIAEYGMADQHEVPYDHP